MFYYFNFKKKLGNSDLGGGGGGNSDMKMTGVLFIPFRGKNIFEPRLPNGILVPFRVFFENFERAPRSFMVVPPRGGGGGGAVIDLTTLLGNRLLENSLRIVLPT